MQLDYDGQEWLEDVSIEAVHVGDYVSLARGPSHPVGCVLRKTPARALPSTRIVGWGIELATGGMWLPCGARLTRRRFSLVPPVPPVPAATAHRRSR